MTLARSEHGAGSAQSMGRWGHRARGAAARRDGYGRDGGSAAGQPLPGGGRGDSLSLGGRAGHGGQRGGDRPGARVPPTERRQGHAAPGRSLHDGRGDDRYGGAGGAGLGGLARVRPGTGGRSRSLREEVVSSSGRSEERRVGKR